MKQAHVANKKDPVTTSTSSRLYSSALIIWFGVALALVSAILFLSYSGGELANSEWTTLEQTLLSSVLILLASSVGVLFTFANVCKRRERELRDTQRPSENYLQIAGSMIVAIDASAKVTFINQAASNVTGYFGDEILGKDWIDTFVPQALQQEVKIAFQKAINGDIDSFSRLNNFKLVRKNGTRVLTSWHNVLIRDQHGGISGILSTGEDVTERVEIEEELRKNKHQLMRLAHHDHLTTLPNRLLFQDRLRHAIAQAQRAKDQVAVLLLDLDRFKSINDTLGHHVGDKFLQVIATRLSSCMRKGDTVARLGGDEFAVVLHKVSNPRDAKAVAEKLLTDLARPIAVENNELLTTTSIGISLYPSGGATVEELLRSADAAMYQAKQSGRNKFHFYSEDMSAKAVAWLNLENDLQHAIEKGQLIVYYQPQYSLSTEKLIGMEALLRWQHPHKGLLQPKDFIALAEESGLILDIGEWALQTACRQARLWQQEGYLPIKISVNLSIRQFRQKNMVERIDGILRKTGLAAKYLELEFKESTVKEDIEAVLFTLIELRCLGISLVIDDFGLGYTSLSNLKNFPVNKLKIDGSFVRQLSQNADDAAITSATIALAHKMGLQVTAESVETPIQAKFLQRQGCDLVQGNLYSSPKPAEQCSEFFERNGSH